MMLRILSSIFVSPEDSMNIARKKWYNYLGNIYKFFQDVYYNIIHITKLSIYNITKLNDIKEIIWVVNPIGVHYLVQTPEIYGKMMFVQKQAYSVKNWVNSRHKSFYVWMMFGWRQLPKEYPSYDSAGPLKPIELSQWVRKSFNLEEYMSRNIYFIERELTMEEPTWKYS